MSYAKRTCCSRWNSARAVAFAAWACLLLPAGCGVHYTVGSEDLEEAYRPPAAPVPEEMKPQPPEGRRPQGQIEVGPLKMAGVTLEEGIRAIRAATSGDCPPIVIVPAALRAAGEKRVSLEIGGAVSLDAALSKFLALFGADISCTAQDEALVIAPASGGGEAQGGLRVSE